METQHANLAGRITSELTPFVVRPKLFATSAFLAVVDAVKQDGAVQECIRKSNHVSRISLKCLLSKTLSLFLYFFAISIPIRPFTKPIDL
jgi:hypothetical protein